MTDSPKARLYVVLHTRRFARANRSAHGARSHAPFLEDHRQDRGAGRRGADLLMASTYIGSHLSIIAPLAELMAATIDMRDALA